VRRGWAWKALPAAALAAILLSSGAAPSLAKSPRKKREPKPAPADFDVKLPVLGTQLAGFSPGPGKAVADLACLQCHSASMVLQQRLNEKQWAKELDKMIGWGAAVPADKRDELLAYLLANFGPDNDRFEPTVTRPVGK
jgi:cytochrome c5